MTNPNFDAPPSEGQTTPSDDNSFAEILSQFEQEHHGEKRGEALRGTVVSIDADSVYVDIGRKMDGTLPLQQFRSATGELNVKPGDILTVNVTGRDQEGLYQLSTIHVERPKDWTGLQAAFAGQLPVAGMVTEVIKGGLRVDVGAKAFLPASRSGTKDAAEMEKLVGQEVQVRIIKLDTTTEDVVVDRRVLVEEEEGKARQRAMEELREGAIVQGTVRTLTDFGAFVEIAPGVDGLLHVADMSWTRVAKPSDVVSPGQHIEAKLLKINTQTKRISLGLKQLIPDPWTMAAERFHPGDRVTGKVSRVTEFGAFVELAPGVDGLVHVSEMSWSKKMRKASEIVKPGEMVDVVVLGVNAAEHRISLGLKQALGDPWEDSETKFPVGAVVEGPVTSMQNFGAFVDLGSGIEGMIHISDISRDKRLNHPREMLSQGQTVRASVLELDRAKRRIRLGMKQLEPTSMDQFIGEHASGEVVTGRVVEIRGDKARVELGESVFADCRFAAEPSASPQPKPAPVQAADLNSSIAALSARWKAGPSAPASAPERKQPARPGEVRSFRILNLDAAKKKIEVELAG